MPIYEYKCTKCEEDFEKLVFGSRKVTCPKCNSSEIKKKMSIFGMSGVAKPFAGTSSCRLFILHQINLHFLPLSQIYSGWRNGFALRMRLSFKGLPSNMNSAVPRSSVVCSPTTHFPLHAIFMDTDVFSISTHLEENVSSALSKLFIAPRSSL